MRTTTDWLISVTSVQYFSSGMKFQMRTTTDWLICVTSVQYFSSRMKFQMRTTTDWLISVTSVGYFYLAWSSRWGLPLIDWLVLPRCDIFHLAWSSRWGGQVLSWAGCLWETHIYRERTTTGLKKGKIMLRIWICLYSNDFGRIQINNSVFNVNFFVNTIILIFLK